MSVLRRQTPSTALSPVDEQNRLPPIFPERQSVSAATPLDFRSLLHSQWSFQRTPFAFSQSLEFRAICYHTVTHITSKVTSPPLTTPRKPTLPILTSPTKTIHTSLVTPSKHTLSPHTTFPHPTRTTLSMLAGRSQPPTIEEENEEEEVGGPTPPCLQTCYGHQEADSPNWHTVPHLPHGTVHTSTLPDGLTPSLYTHYNLTTSQTVPTV